MTVATAGHEPPLLVSPDRGAEALQTDGGRVLGLIELGDYPSSTLTLGYGERGRLGVERLMAEAFDKGLIPNRVPVEFAA